MKKRLPKVIRMMRAAEKWVRGTSSNGGALASFKTNPKRHTKRQKYPLPRPADAIRTGAAA